MKKIVVLVALLLTSTAFAMPTMPTIGSNTDYTCMRDCQNMGYMYGYCQKLCSY